ncbi:MAG: RidA family protein, partial [Cellulosimicrobium funkei]
MAGVPAGTVAARLAELGITLPRVAAPVAAYVPAVRTGRYVHTSGQLPFVDGALLATGKVGDGEGLVAPADAADLARVCALNALAAVAAGPGEHDDGGGGGKGGGVVGGDPAVTGPPRGVYRA